MEPPSAFRRRSRYAGLSQQEVAMLLAQHTAPRAMAFFDALPPEQRALVREGLAPVRGETWRLQSRDARGRFGSVRD